MAPARDLCFTPATELVRLFRARRVSPLELMHALLARIDAVNPTVNAIVTLARESALAEARRATGALRRGARLGPLHGVPVAIKDVTPTRGLKKIIAPSEPIQDLAEGFGGTQGPAEGPVWWKEGRYLLFSDIHNNRRMKYVPGQGVTLFQEPTNRANGLTRDLQGRLIACEHDSRRVTRQELDGSLTVIANSFQGRRLNRPNDVVVKSDGCIYFTDPWTSPSAPEQWDLTFAGVYRVTPDLGTMSLLVADFVLPNGLAFSPDERCSTSTIRGADTSGRSTSCPMARSRNRPTASSRTCREPSPASPTA